LWQAETVSAPLGQGPGVLQDEVGTTWGSLIHMASSQCWLLHGTGWSCQQEHLCGVCLWPPRNSWVLGSELICLFLSIPQNLLLFVFHVRL
jgi:hypothetical protein